MLLAMASGVARDHDRRLSEFEADTFQSFTYNQLVRPLVVRDRHRGMSYAGIATKYELTYGQVEWICKLHAKKMVDSI